MSILSKGRISEFLNKPRFTGSALIAIAFYVVAVVKAGFATINYVLMQDMSEVKASMTAVAIFLVIAVTFHIKAAWLYIRNRMSSNVKGTG